MPKKAIWISYDLGIKRDFPGLYAWLDNQDAKEAGNSLDIIPNEKRKPEKRIRNLKPLPGAW